MAAPLSTVRQRPIPSKFSSESPIGSISLWQLAHVGLRRCSSIRSRIERAFAGVSSSGGTFAGASGGGVPRILVSTYLPRSTGEVRLFCDVSARMLPCPSSPRRASSLTATFLNCVPYTFGIP